MTDRERLINLMIEAKRTDPETGSFTDYLADYLLKHGVIVLPADVVEVRHGSGLKLKSRWVGVMLIALNVLFATKVGL